jgi:hypothetical protein
MMAFFSWQGKIPNLLAIDDEHVCTYLSLFHSHMDWKPPVEAKLRELIIRLEIQELIIVNNLSFSAFAIATICCR